MPHPTNIIWTAALATAVKAIASDFGKQDETRRSLATDVRERASQMARMQVGATVAPMQVDFVNMFRSRLSDPYLSFKAAPAFNDAWGAAYNLAKES